MNNLIKISKRFYGKYKHYLFFSFFVGLFIFQGLLNSQNSNVDKLEYKNYNKDIKTSDNDFSDNLQAELYDPIDNLDDYYDGIETFYYDTVGSSPSILTAGTGTILATYSNHANILRFTGSNGQALQYLQEPIESTENWNVEVWLAVGNDANNPKMEIVDINGNTKVSVYFDYDSFLSKHNIVMYSEVYHLDYNIESGISMNTWYHVRIRQQNGNIAGYVNGGYGAGFGSSESYSVRNLEFTQNTDYFYIDAISYTNTDEKTQIQNIEYTQGLNFNEIDNTKRYSAYDSIINHYPVDSNNYRTYFQNDITYNNDLLDDSRLLRMIGSDTSQNKYKVIQTDFRNLDNNNSWSNISNNILADTSTGYNIIDGSLNSEGNLALQDNDPFIVDSDGYPFVSNKSNGYTGNYLENSTDADYYNYTIEITENSGSDLTNYEVMLTIDTETLIDERKMNPDCSDIRFNYTDGTPIDYYIESGIDSTETIIWIEIDILASETIEIVMQYGKSEYTSLSSASDVFDFFDDFDDLSNWNYYGCSVSSGIMTCPAYSRWIKSISTYTYDKAVDSLYRINENMKRNYGFASNIPFPNGVDGSFAHCTTGVLPLYDGFSHWYMTNTPTSDQWHIESVERHDGSAKLKMNYGLEADDLVEADSSHFSTGNWYIGFNTWGSGSGRVEADWIRIRDSIENEPTVSYGQTFANNITVINKTIDICISDLQDERIDCIYFDYGLNTSIFTFANVSIYNFDTEMFELINETMFDYEYYNNTHRILTDFDRYYNSTNDFLFRIIAFNNTDNFSLGINLFNLTIEYDNSNLPSCSFTIDSEAIDTSKSYDYVLNTVIKTDIEYSFINVSLYNYDLGIYEKISYNKTTDYIKVNYTFTDITNYLSLSNTVRVLYNSMNLTNDFSYYVDCLNITYLQTTNRYNNQTIQVRVDTFDNSELLINKLYLNINFNNTQGLITWNCLYRESASLPIWHDYLTNPIFDFADYLEQGTILNSLQINLHFFLCYNDTHKLLMLRTQVGFNDRTDLIYEYDKIINLGYGSFYYSQSKLQVRYFDYFNGNYATDYVGNTYYTYNNLYGFRTLETDSDDYYYNFLEAGWFSTPLTLPDLTPEDSVDGDEPDEPKRPTSRYWEYTSFHLAYDDIINIYYKDNVDFFDTTIPVESDYDFKTVKGVERTSEYPYTKNFFDKDDFGNWKFKIVTLTVNFNPVRDFLISTANSGMVYVQYFIFLLFWTLAYIFTYLVIALILPFIWNYPIYWLSVLAVLFVHYVSVLFVWIVGMLWTFLNWIYEEILIPFLEWLYEVALPLFIEFLITIFVLILTCFMWLAFLGQRDFWELYDTNTEMTYMVIDFMIELFIDFLENYPYFILYFVYYVILIGFTLIDYIYCKSRGFSRRAESLKVALEVYLFPFVIIYSLIVKIKELITRNT